MSDNGGTHLLIRPDFKARRNVHEFVGREGSTEVRASPLTGGEKYFAIDFYEVLKLNIRSG
jgi:hypothetical protein